MELGTVNLPPYLYNPEAATLSLKDNRRFTMRDIGNIEDRVSNLEEVTTLSLLEMDIQSLQIQDSEGRNRFKTGFFVDPFKNYRSISRQSQIQINRRAQELIPVRSRNTLASQLTPKLSTTSSSLDFNSNFDLFDENVQKTGDAVTLKYDEEVWFGQYYATLLKDGSLGIINVNPYELPAILGDVDLQPNTDIWTRTHQLDDNIIHQSGTDSSVDLNLAANGTLDLGDITNTIQTSEHHVDPPSNIQTGTTVTSSTSDINGSLVLTGSDSVQISNTDITIQNRLISSSAEDHMRSRNTEFKASGFPGGVRTYLFIDGQKIEDVIPKLLAISKTPGGTEYGSDINFILNETVIAEDPTTGEEIMRFRLCRPDHKSGPLIGYDNITGRPEEVYGKDPYTNQDLSSSYTVSTPVLNIDTRGLAEEAQGQYFGYLVANAKLIGQESSAVAYVKDWENNKMVADEYGDVIGSFFLRDPNETPQPPIKITTGRKNVRVTTSPTNVKVPAENLILGEGRGFEVSQGRLGPGRIHHCMRAIGQAEKALELMIRRSKTRTAFGKELTELGANYDIIANCRMEIEQSRLLCLKAAWMMDTAGVKAAQPWISQIKVVAPLMALKVIDEAIQMHGGMGISQDTPLAHMWTHVRTLRLADGPDAVHRRQVARAELRRYSN